MDESNEAPKPQAYGRDTTETIGSLGYAGLNPKGEVIPRPSFLSRFFNFLRPAAKISAGAAVVAGGTVAAVEGAKSLGTTIESVVNPTKTQIIQEIKEHPERAVHGLVVGKDGANLRGSPSAVENETKVTMLPPKQVIESAFPVKGVSTQGNPNKSEAWYAVTETNPNGEVNIIGYVNSNTIDRVSPKNNP